MESELTTGHIWASLHMPDDCSVDRFKQWVVEHPLFSSLMQGYNVKQQRKENSPYISVGVNDWSYDRFLSITYFVVMLKPVIWTFQPPKDEIPDPVIITEPVSSGSETGSDSDSDTNDSIDSQEDQVSGEIIEHGQIAEPDSGHRHRRVLTRSYEVTREEEEVTVTALDWVSAVSCFTNARSCPNNAEGEINAEQCQPDSKARLFG